ncbi:MAG: lysophospholipid acyltransferase family protein [Planctomycetota bacterium]
MSAPARQGRLAAAAFWVLWAMVRAGLRLCCRLRIEGPLPPAGACVLAANHVSLLDPIVLGAALPRRIVYLMTTTFYRSRSMGWFYRWNQAIAISARGGNREALRAARGALAAGRTIGIFPEGGISRDGLPMLGSPGAVALVLHAGVPIVPIGLVGTDDALPFGGRWPRFRRITVRFGEPLTAAELSGDTGERRQVLQQATNRIMDRIATLCGHRSRAGELAASSDGAASGQPAR